MLQHEFKVGLAVSGVAAWMVSGHDSFGCTVAGKLLGYAMVMNVLAAPTLCLGKSRVCVESSVTVGDHLICHLQGRKRFCTLPSGCRGEAVEGACCQDELQTALATHLLYF